MTKLEEAINELGRHSWHGINVITKNSDFHPMSSKDFEEHIKTCEIWPLYESIVRAAASVKAEWIKTSKQAKDMLFRAALEDKKE